MWTTIFSGFFLTSLELRCPPVDESLEAWFAREVLPLEGALTRYLARSRVRLADIEDVRNDVYVRVLQAVEQARPTSARSFLFTTARNLIIDRARRGRIVPIQRLPETEISNVLIDEVSPERRTTGLQQLQFVARLVDALPRRCREVLWMRRVEGISARDAGVALGIDSKTVDRHLCRALQLLTSRMNGEGSQDSTDKDAETASGENEHVD